jgi:hypothetical protein
MDLIELIVDLRIRGFVLTVPGMADNLLRISGLLPVPPYLEKRP